MVTPVFAHIGAVDLFELLWQTLEPKWLKESKGFILDPHTDLELFDKNYCLISPPPPPEPDNAAISSFFFVKSRSGKKGVTGSDRKFKTGTTLVYVCMTHDVYDRWQNYCDQVEHGSHGPGPSQDKSVTQVVSSSYYAVINCTILILTHDVQPTTTTRTVSSSKAGISKRKSTVGVY